MSMPIVGYTDRLTVGPGQTVDFKISCDAPTFTASLVRLIHGDANPAGPGFKAQHIASSIEGTHPGQHQALSAGSYVRVPYRNGLTSADSFTVHLWIWPTLPTGGRQTLLSQGRVSDGGYALGLEEGKVTFRVGSQILTVPHVLLARRWYSVAAVVDVTAGEVRLDVVTKAINRAAEHHRVVGAIEMSTRGEDDVLIAAEQLDSAVTGNYYNGKIDAPRIYDSALSESALEAISRDAALDAQVSQLAAWDFSLDISNWTVTDTAGDFHGHTVNKPMRGATGHNWDGTETAWPHAPAQYGAIHFHDDDLADAGWATTFQWTVPEDLPSAVYAAHVRAGDAEDYVPVFVRPRRGAPTAKIALLMPTFSYLAYANEQLLNNPLLTDKGDYPSQVQDRYIVENGLLSLYDKHSDGTGVCYSSRLRPVVNMRPKCNMAWLDGGKGSPHQFNADLHIVDWLYENHYDVDIYTDEDLHREGSALLEPYKAVLTGTHAEYWSAEMLDATQQYLRGGGRLMSLSGNGMYWVTQLDPETGTSIEIRRRGPATRMWEPEPGEAHLSSTGELGGLWRFRGRGPHTWIGAGHTAETAGTGRPYRRTEQSYDPAVSFVFEGVDGDTIGDIPCLVNSYGAAGFEFDRADVAVGTPVETMILATADGFDDDAQGTIEDVLLADSMQGGTQSPLVRADMTLLKYPAGGAVFAVSSIAWSGCLSYNGYDNDVSRITRNVLEAYVSDRV